MQPNKMPGQVCKTPKNSKELRSARNASQNPVMGSRLLTRGRSPTTVPCAVGLLAEYGIIALDTIRSFTVRLWRCKPPAVFDLARTVGGLGLPRRRNALPRHRYAMLSAPPRPRPRPRPPSAYYVLSNFLRNSLVRFMSFL